MIIIDCIHTLTLCKIGIAKTAKIKNPKDQPASLITCVKKK